jgi:uncharacterized membrane protein
MFTSPFQFSRTACHPAIAALMALAALGIGSPRLAVAGYVYTTFDPPGASSSLGFGINDQGRIVGGYTDSQGGHGFVRDLNGRFTTLDDAYSGVFGINNAGTMVGRYADPSAFILRGDGRLETYAASGADRTNALGINDLGQVTGPFHGLDGIEHGYFRDSAGTLTPFDVPGAVVTEPYGISNAGTIVGLYSYVSEEGHEHGFLRDPSGAFTLIDVPGTIASGFLGISPSGSLISGFYEDSAGFHGFVWDGHGPFVPLDVPGASSSVALGITDRGQVTGYYYDAAGTSHGFLAMSVPEPGSFILVTIGCVLGSCWSVRRRR